MLTHVMKIQHWFGQILVSKSFFLPEQDSRSGNSCAVTELRVAMAHSLKAGDASGLEPFPMSSC